MRKTEKIVAEGQVMLHLEMERGHLYIRDPHNGNTLEFWPDELEQLYGALGRFLGKESSPGESS